MPKTTNQLTDFGKWVKKVLIDKEMTVSELAKAIGYSQTMVSKVIHGERPGQRCRAEITKYLSSLDIDKVS